MADFFIYWVEFIRFYDGDQAYKEDAMFYNGVCLPLQKREQSMVGNFPKAPSSILIISIRKEANPNKITFQPSLISKDDRTNLYNSLIILDC